MAGLCSTSRSWSRSRYIYFSNTSWRNMNNQSQTSFTQLFSFGFTWIDCDFDCHGHGHGHRLFIWASLHEGKWTTNRPSSKPNSTIGNHYHLPHVKKHSEAALIAHYIGPASLFEAGIATCKVARERVLRTGWGAEILIHGTFGPPKKFIGLYVFCFQTNEEYHFSIN